MESPRPLLTKPIAAGPGYPSRSPCSRRKRSTPKRSARERLLFPASVAGLILSSAILPEAPPSEISKALAIPAQRERFQPFPLTGPRSAVESQFHIAPNG